MKVFTLTGLIFVYVIYGLYLAQYNVAILPESLKAEPPRGYFDYRGVTNVHTNMSSGSGDITRVIADAQTAGLDFLSITDTNVFDKPSSLAGYHSSLLVMLDGEYSYLNSRLLNIGATTSRHLQGVGRSQVLFADLLSQVKKEDDVGLLYLAHPLKARYKWSGEYPQGLDGIEIINLKNVWQDAWNGKKFAFLVSLTMYPFNEKLALLRRAAGRGARVVDKLSQQRPVAGIAGADAEAKLMLGGAYLKFPTYETLFSLVRNHVLLRSELTGNANNDVEKLATAFRQGQFYMSLDILGNPKGFNALIRNKQNQNFPMGSRLVYEDGMVLDVTLPQKPDAPFDVVIYRNGERMMTSNSQTTQYYLTGPGVYRVMVRVIPTLPLPDGKKWIPWIYTNPFYLAEKSAPASSGTRSTKPSTGGN